MKGVRIAVAVIGFLSAIFLPWWIPVVCIVILALRWRSWEAILLGVFMDLLWLSPTTGLPLFTIFAIVIVWILEPLRNEFLA